MLETGPEAEEVTEPAGTYTPLAGRVGPDDMLLDVSEAGFAQTPHRVIVSVITMVAYPVKAEFDGSSD